MQVELSERAHQRIQELVGDGTYESAEAVVEAALEQFEHPDFADVDLDEMERRARSVRERQGARTVDDAYVAEIRSRAHAIAESKATS